MNQVGAFDVGHWIRSSSKAFRVFDFFATSVECNHTHTQFGLRVEKETDKPCHVTSSHRVMLGPVTSYRVMSGLVVSCHAVAMFRHVITSRVTPCRLTSCHVMSCLLSWPFFSCGVLSSLLVFCLFQSRQAMFLPLKCCIMPCHFMSGHFCSCHAMSCHVMSFLLVSFFAASCHVM